MLKQSINYCSEVKYRNWSTNITIKKADLYIIVIQIKLFDSCVFNTVLFYSVTLYNKDKKKKANKI